MCVRIDCQDAAIDRGGLRQGTKDNGALGIFQKPVDNLAFVAVIRHAAR